MTISLLLSLALSTQAAERDFRTWVERRDAGVVRQQWDFSCGLASLATLLTYYFDDAVSEKVLLNALPEDVGRRQRGVSLQDLASLAEGRGYRAAGLGASADALLRLRRPVIVYLELEGQPHFSVLRGIDGSGRVLLADPSGGNRRVSRGEFARWFEVQDGARGRLLLLDGGAARTPRRSYFAYEAQAPLLAPRLPAYSSR